MGIESSCDETAAAVVEDGVSIRSSVVASQLDVHARYGGVVPELASREHLRSITPVVREAMAAAALDYPDLDAIAVTEGPGLVGSLLVGITFAKALAWAHGKPLVAVHHLEGHLHAVVMEHRAALRLPALGLVVSGGHTHLYALEEEGEQWRYCLIGRTRDDAAGEAYDKVAKLLGFAYPGGPIIDRLASYGNPHAIRFSSPCMKGNPLDFSFSGIKTAVRYWVADHDLESEIAVRRRLLSENPRPTLAEWLERTPQRTLDLLASFQYAVITDLLDRAEQAARKTSARSLLISGGVASNAGLRRAVGERRLPFPVFFPQAALATDNAVMIAAAAYPKLLRGETAEWSLRAKANLPL